MSTISESPGTAASAKARHPVPLRNVTEKGDVLRLLGLPEIFIVGLDTLAITTNKSLLGFRDIPTGPHFLWVQQPGGASRCGCWFVTGKPGTVRIKEWDGYNEVLAEPRASLNPMDTEAVYPNLQPYALHDRRDNVPAPLPQPQPNRMLPQWAHTAAGLWRVLTSAISSRVLDRIIGIQNAAEYPVDSMDLARDPRGGEGLPTRRTNPTSVTNELTFLFAQDFRDLQVLDRGPERASVADTSARVQALLARAEGRVTEEDVLGELQFAFLTGTHLGNPACIEQWWNLVLRIVLRAYRLAVARPGFAGALLRTLHAQLFYTENYVGSASSHADDPPDDAAGGGKTGPNSDRAIFQYKPQNKEKLRQALAQYKKQVNRLLQAEGSRAITEQPESVGQTFEELEAWLWRYNWDLTKGGDRARPGDRVDVADSEDEEDEQPVVVQLDEEGREVGLVSFTS